MLNIGDRLKRGLLMKKCKLYFEIELPFMTKAYTPLKELGNSDYDPKTKKYTWKFKLKDLRKVLAIVGHPIIFDKDEAELAIQYSKDLKKKIVSGPKQGVGFVDVKIHPIKPNYFIVTTVRERQPQNTNVAFETVHALWRAIKKQPLDTKRLTHTVAENYCKELGIVDFNTYKDNRFNWKYFSGSRKSYLVFYAAIKVLAHFGAVEHVVKASKSGVIKKKEVWEIQTEL